MTSFCELCPTTRRERELPDLFDCFEYVFLLGRLNLDLDLLLFANYATLSLTRKSRTSRLQANCPSTVSVPTRCQSPMWKTWSLLWHSGQDGLVKVCPLPHLTLSPETVSERLLHVGQEIRIFSEGTLHIIFRVNMAGEKTEKIAWKERTAIVAIHVTPERKRQWKELAKAMGSENLQNAFEEFMKSKLHLSGLSDLKKTYLSLKEQQVQLGKALGKERLLVLVNVYKRLGGDVKDLSNYQKVCGKMLKEWCPRQDPKSRAITEVIQFEAYLEVNKKREETERELIGYVDGAGAGAGVGAAMATVPASTP